MLFHGALAGLSAVILADSGASHTMINQSYAPLDQLKIRPCPYPTANLANGVSVGLLGQTTVKIGLGKTSVTVTALVLPTLVPGVHVILGDEWLTNHKVRIDYETLYVVQPPWKQGGAA